MEARKADKNRRGGVAGDLDPVEAEVALNFGDGDEPNPHFN